MPSAPDANAINTGRDRSCSEAPCYLRVGLPSLRAAAWLGGSATGARLAPGHADKGMGQVCSRGRGNLWVSGVKIRFRSPAELPFLDHPLGIR